jgi:transglutaminase superfamily protein
VTTAERLRRLRRGLRQVSRLPYSDRTLFLLAWRSLVASRIRVRWGRVDWAEAVVEQPNGPATREIDHLVALFDAARDTLPVGASCLPRSLALRRFLAQNGVGTRLRLGARKVGREWSGHVWVERNGRIVGDRPELVRVFVPFRETA